MTKQPEKRSVGAPTKFDREKAERVCSLLAEGKTLSQSCREVDVPRKTFTQWVIDDRDGISAQYARARDLCFDAQHDMLVDIGQDRTRDTTNIAVNRDRLFSDNVKWSLARMKPERYGDSIKVDQRTTLVSVKDTPEELVDEKVDWATRHSPDTQH